MSVGPRSAIRYPVAQWVGRWRLRIWGALAVALGIGLGWLPLFGVLGFELATAAALFAAILGLDLGSAVARAHQRRLRDDTDAASADATATADATAASDATRTAAARTLLGSVFAAVVLAVAVTAIPAAIAAIRGIWTPTCDWWFGIVSYLAMPLATAALAAAVGCAVGIATGPRRFAGAIAAQVPALAVALAALWRFYSEPPVFSYNAILGYFPGNLYDENIQLSWPLVWSRLEDLLWVVAVLAVVALRLDTARHRLRRRVALRRGALAVVLAAIAGAATVHHFGGALGYAPDADDLAAVLDGRIETDHFIIHYAHTSDIDADIALIARDHEFRYAEVVAQLGVAPAGKLRSFYFADGDQKARWFGARGVEMAKPWRREIYLDHRGFPHGSLRHEIAHAVASAFGDPLFGVATRDVVFANPGLIEGLAVAVDWPGSYEQPTPHESVRAMSELGVQPAIGRLLSLEFFSVSSARGYTTAGSFLRFLLERRGPAPLRALYRSGGDFTAAYGAPLASLEAEWRAFVAAIELPPGTSEALRERFRGGSVFARPCPHAIAARRARAARALDDNDRPLAESLLREICSDSPDEPRHRLELSDLLHSGGPTSRLEAEAIWLSLSSDEANVTSTLRVQSLERLARAAAARDDRDGVTRWIRAAAALPVDANERRQLAAEQLALSHTGAAAAPLYAYFFGPGPLDNRVLAGRAVAAEPAFAFAHYLLGLQLQFRGDWPGSAAALDRALGMDLPGTLFVRNAARRLAVAAYRAGDRARVARAIEVLLRPELPTADHLLAADWQSRLDFDSKH